MAKDINAVMAGWKDRGPWIYYDTMFVAAGGVLQSTYNPFSIPMGGVDPVFGFKTKLQTNMIAPSNFGSSRCLVLEQIGFYIPTSLSKHDVDAILSSAYLEMRIEEKIYYEGLLAFYPGGMGLKGVTTIDAQETWTLGEPIPKAARRYGAYSKYIAPLQQFTWSIFFPGTPPTLTTSTSALFPFLIPIMDGLTDRSVQ